MMSPRSLRKIASFILRLAPKDAYHGNAVRAAYTYGSMRSFLACCLSLFLLIVTDVPFGIAAEAIPIGLASRDVTPDYPIRLTGYGNRRDESEGVDQRLWAKAIAFGEDKTSRSLMLTVDNCGIPDAMRTEVLERINREFPLESSNFAICFSHTHCAPRINGSLVNMFSSEVPSEHQVNIDRYTHELTDALVQVALDAFRDVKPSQLSTASGEAKFARNRRVAYGGPVDHDLPVLFVHDAVSKTLRGIVVNYACHATTLSHNRIHGDWPGVAMEFLERQNPTAIAMVCIGCGADQNPNPRGTIELATQHGAEVAREVQRLLGGPRTPITSLPQGAEKIIQLPLAQVRTKPEWEALAASLNTPRQLAYLAKKNIERLDRGEVLPKEVIYRIQQWSFGDELAMVHLPGEVTVDYQLRLKIELDRKRLWVNAYANDAPCYIPSEKVLAEGGYEGETAMSYYDWPAKFAPGLETKIIDAVHAIVPSTFAAKYRAEVPPKSPADALQSIEIADENLLVELVAAEPFTVDPVAIDWDTQGRMWVVEQSDYPNGMDNQWKPGGKLRILVDSDKDGRYDFSHCVLEDLPFPTGVTCWRQGALVCAAPDILYVEDTDGDYRCDKVEKLFSGFATDNYNARVNSLFLGLDGWLHGANGKLGGKITCHRTGEVIDIEGRDIRIDPDRGVLQVVSGVTQQGRCRDDWDNWFGCSNSRWLFQFPLPEHYVARNPYVPFESLSQLLTPGLDNSTVYPISKSLERFNNPESQGHITSATGLGIYRDTLLGKDYYGNAFIGEVAHNLVRRFVLTGEGPVLEAKRAPEGNREFFASRDNWCRPVQIRTGPDGALYIVDMVRSVIEHTRWIPADRLERLDPREGDTLGRIYRVVPKNEKLRPVVDLTSLSNKDLVQALASPNGTVRDLVQQELLSKPRDEVYDSLKTFVDGSHSPQIRLQALAILCRLDPEKSSDFLEKAFTDDSPQIRRFAIRSSEPFMANDAQLRTAMVKLADDPSLVVRYQLALSLGEDESSMSGLALNQIAINSGNNRWIRAAIVSSAKNRTFELSKSVYQRYSADPESMELGLLWVDLVATAAAQAKDASELKLLYPSQLNFRANRAERAELLVLERLLARHDQMRVNYIDGLGKINVAFAMKVANTYATDNKIDRATREIAVRILGRHLKGLELGFGRSNPRSISDDNDSAKIRETLLDLAIRETDPVIQRASFQAIGFSTDEGMVEPLIRDWRNRTPAQRSLTIGLLLSRETWTEILLTAIEQGTVDAMDIPVTHQQSLREHKVDSIRNHAQRALPVRNSEDRRKLAAKLSGEINNLNGDAIRGSKVFLSKCATCHSYLGIGHAVGPDLKAYYNKSVSDFVTAIVDPNAAIEPRYASYVVLTEDDRNLMGVIGEESATHVEVIQANGVREQLLKIDNPQIRATGLSLMPEGLEKAMTPQDIADVIAYIKSGG